MGVGGDMMYSLERNRCISAPLSAVLLTWNVISTQGFPPEPCDADKSIVSDAHAPMVVGADITTEGITGSIGGSIETIVESTDSQVEHFAALGPAQAARSFPPNSSMWSPIFKICRLLGNIDTVDPSADHAQRANVSPMNERSVAQSKDDTEHPMPPPQSVCESNTALTNIPSSEYRAIDNSGIGGFPSKWNEGDLVGHPVGVDDGSEEGINDGMFEGDVVGSLVG